MFFRLLAFLSVSVKTFFPKRSHSPCHVHWYKDILFSHFILVKQINQLAQFECKKIKKQQSKFSSEKQKKTCSNRDVFVTSGANLVLLI